MDIYRKELNEIYALQHLDDEKLPRECIEIEKSKAEVMASVGQGCLVITDASTDSCYIHGGKLGQLMGFFGLDVEYMEESSSDEDIIYSRINPEDLVDKRLLEYEFFKFINNCSPDRKLNYKAVCRVRMMDAEGRERYIDNSTRILRLSPAGMIWLILCSYDVSPNQSADYGISPKIVDMASGEIISLNFNVSRASILTGREKEILSLIRDGLPSKQISDKLNISVNTVNRHRQNIISKLSVGNSIEAVMAAQAMRLL